MIFRSYSVFTTCFHYNHHSKIRVGCQILICLILVIMGLHTMCEVDSKMEGDN